MDKIKFVRKRHLFLTFGIFGAVVASWLTLTLLFSWLSLSNLKEANFSPTYQYAKIATTLFWPIRTVFGPVSPDVRLWNKSLELIAQVAKLGESGQTYVPSSLAGENSASETAQQISSSLPLLQQTLEEWLDLYPQASITQKIVNQQRTTLPFSTYLDSPNELKKNSQQLVELAQYLMTGKHRIVFLLQNSDELRATGGFMGSYALLELQDGVVTIFDVQDIYVPDGQFEGFVDAPAGVREYLSAGKGFRLPDANWSPDFPASAQEVLRFLALGKENQIEAVVAINDSVVESMLELTGWIYLPDYDQTVTADNLSVLARADRSEFFPGSQQKKQFLDALFTQLKIRLVEIIQQKPDQFFELIRRKIDQKEIMAFSNSAPLQQFFTSFHVDGLVLTGGAGRYFYLVESNVGINKANRLVYRDVTLELFPTQSTVTIHFRNQNPPTNLKEERGDYVNYQRIFTLPSFNLEKISINDQTITKWDEEIVTTVSGEQVKQIGFLVTVPAKSESQVKVSFSHPYLSDTAVFVQKQSGLPSVPYHIQTPQQVIEVLLERDWSFPSL